MRDSRAVMLWITAICIAVSASPGWGGDRGVEQQAQRVAEALVKAAENKGAGWSKEIKDYVRDAIRHAFASAISTAITAEREKQLTELLVKQGVKFVEAGRQGFLSPRELAIVRKIKIEQLAWQVAEWLKRPPMSQEQSAAVRKQIQELGKSFEQWSSGLVGQVSAKALERAHTLFEQSLLDRMANELDPHVKKPLTPQQQDEIVRGWSSLRRLKDIYARALGRAAKHRGAAKQQAEAEKAAAILERLAYAAAASAALAWGPPMPKDLRDRLKKLYEELHKSVDARQRQENGISPVVQMLAGILGRGVFQTEVSVFIASLARDLAPPLPSLEDVEAQAK